MIVVTALGGTWGLEQPNSSCLEFFPTFRAFLNNMLDSHGSSAATRLHSIVHSISLLPSLGSLQVYKGSSCIYFLNMWPHIFLQHMYIDHYLVGVRLLCSCGTGPTLNWDYI